MSGICDVKMPKGEGEDVGRALEPEEQSALLEACRKSRYRGLHTAFLVSLRTGLRSAELRHLQWRHIDLIGTKDDAGKSAAGSPLADRRPTKARAEGGDYTV
jgi:integrase